MLRRDYIIRMIEELGQCLARVRVQVSERQYPEADAALEKALEQLLGSDRDVDKLSETELLALLTVDGPTQMVREKTLILVALLQEAGRLRVAQGREREGEACWLKALNLLLTMKLQDADLEFPEFVPKIDLLRDQLRDTELPLQTLAALWRHYERTGEFGRAEDALSGLLEADPDNAALREEAKLFYGRLLRESDRALEAGNLPRAEVEAGLADLRG
jgi:tetratricopeptide (TPR) repeat protein